MSKSLESPAPTPYFHGGDAPAHHSSAPTPAVIAEEKSEDPTIPFFTALELQVFKTFIENYTETKEMTREDCIALHTVFGPVFLQCLQIIEEDQVVIKHSPISGRMLILVDGSTGNYCIAPGNAVCQCVSFAHRGKKEYCKHILAAHLFLAITPKEKYESVSDYELGKIFSESLSIV